MQWSSDRNSGFSRANPQKLYLPVTIDPEYHYEAVNVEAQQNNPHSLIWWMKRLLALSRRFKAFGRGSMELLTPENRRVFAFLRRYGEDSLLVVANLSRFVQFVELDLTAFKGRVPVELFGRTEFPPVGDRPYLLTLGPHAFYWFALESSVAGVKPDSSAAPALEVPEPWPLLLRERGRNGLEEVLGSYLARSRWFAGKSRRIKSVRVSDAVPLDLPEAPAVLALVRVEFSDGAGQLYGVPLAAAWKEGAQRVRSELARAVVAPIRPRGGEAAGEEGVLFDAAYDPAFGAALLDAIRRNRRIAGPKGVVSGRAAPALQRLDGTGDPLPVAPLRGEQSNTSIVYGDRLVLKLIRRLEGGAHPDLEIGRFLTERAGFPHAAPVAGSIEYAVEGEEPITLAVLHGFVTNEGDAWTYTLDALGRYFEGVRSRPRPLPEDAVPGVPLTELIASTPPPEVRDLMGSYLEVARLLGHRTSELHAALSSTADDPAFSPEPFTPFYQRSIYQSMRSQAGQVLSRLRKLLPGLPPPVRGEAERALDLERDLLAAFQTVSERRIDAVRIRCHGDYHLGQVLHTGKDFVILDFEGEPSRPLGERRIKRCALRDVAGMVRSFHYAASSALLDQESRGEVAADRLPALEAAAQAWSSWASSAFLRAYLQRSEGGGFVPRSPDDLHVLLTAYLLDKCVYEIGYELEHRPAWLRIPLRGLVHLLQSGGR